MTKIENLKYHELKALASENGLAATGTTEVLIQRLKDANVTAKAATEAPEEVEEDEVEEEEEEEAPKAISKQQEAAAQRNADSALRTDARNMKAHLDKQKKISIMIPFEVGENPESGKNVPFHVNLNGYKMNLARGEYIEVPEQIADLIKERLESEGKIGSQWRLDRNSSQQDALS